MKRIIAAIVAAIALLFAGVACSSSQADVASHNLSKAADQFQVERRIVFFNSTLNGTNYLLTIEGRCSLGNSDPANELTVTCKVGPNEYKKHFLGLSNTVSYFVEQMQANSVSVYHYKVLFRPSTVVPDISGG